MKRTCENCSVIFSVSARQVKYDIKRGRARGKYCSTRCFFKHKTTSRIIPCTQCGIEFQKHLNQIVKTKNHFCCRSCAATYNNRNKTTGTRRSKLEIYIEQRVREIYPKLEIIVNGKNAIGQELDFYFPALNLALEINGIFHYKPIYGEEKLKQIQANDESKLKACTERNIQLITYSDNATRFTAKTAEAQWETVRLLCQLDTIAQAV